MMATTDLESFFTDRRQKEGRDINECLTILYTEPYNDAYCKKEFLFPVPQNVKKSYYLVDCDEYMHKQFEKKGRPFIAFQFSQRMMTDMYDTFQSNVEYSIWIGREEYTLDRLLHFGCSYCDVCILLYLDTVAADIHFNTITFSFHQHILSNAIRCSMFEALSPRDPTSPKGIVDGNILYMKDFVVTYPYIKNEVEGSPVKN